MHAGRHHCDEAPARPAFRHRHGTLHVCAGVDCRKAGSAVRDASARPPSCTGIAVCMFCGALSARGGRVGLHAESLCIGGCGHHVCGGGLHAGAGHSSAGVRINGRNNGSASCRQGSGWTACHALLPCGMHLHVRLHASLSMTARSAGMSSPEAVWAGFHAGASASAGTRYVCGWKGCMQRHLHWFGRLPESRWLLSPLNTEALHVVAPSAVRRIRGGRQCFRCLGCTSAVLLCAQRFVRKEDDHAGIGRQDCTSCSMAMEWGSSRSCFRGLPESPCCCGKPPARLRAEDVHAWFAVLVSRLSAGGRMPCTFCSSALRGLLHSFWCIVLQKAASTPARRNVFLMEDAMHHCGWMASSFPALGLTRLTGLAFGLCCSRLPLKLFLPFHQVVLHAPTACRSCLPKTGKAVLGSPPKSVAAFLSKIVLSSDAPLPPPGVPCPLPLRTGSTPARFASPCQALRPGPAPASGIPSGDA